MRYSYAPSQPEPEVTIVSHCVVGKAVGININPGINFSPVFVKSQRGDTYSAGGSVKMMNDDVFMGKDFRDIITYSKGIHTEA